MKQLSPELITLGKYFSGIFENKEQAQAEPIWYVYLRLWHQPIDLFTEDSLTFFAEQANIVKLHQPYRPRVIRFCQQSDGIYLHYYLPHDIELVRGGGVNIDKLAHLREDNIEFLPKCSLKVNYQSNNDGLMFTTSSATTEKCFFNYQGNTYRVDLGYEITKDSLKTFDKGINPIDGTALWGAIMGPYIYQKTCNLPD